MQKQKNKKAPRRLDALARGAGHCRD